MIAWLHFNLVSVFLFGFGIRLSIQGLENLKKLQTKTPTESSENKIHKGPVILFSHGSNIDPFVMLYAYYVSGLDTVGNLRSYWTATKLGELTVVLEY